MPKAKNLDGSQIKTLEHEIAKAIAAVIDQHREELPVGPDRPTMHCMAKAAVAAYEAAACQASQ